MSPPTTQQHRRAGKPKSKKGCITCKIRHVKCGEEKPECKQCTSTGRKCDGYSHASQKQLHAEIKKSSSPPQVLPAGANIGSDNRLVLIPGTRQERQYVQFFCEEATNALSGFFPSDFWNRILPQISHQNPILRHAAAAMGATYEQYALRGPGEENVTEGFALQQYNKAIQNFREQALTAQGANYHVILMTCALFACLEMLRANQNEAMDHVVGGVQILLAKLRQSPSQDSSTQSSKSLTSQSNFDRELFQFFYRMDLQTSLSGRELHFYGIPPEDKTAPHVSIDDALTFQNITYARDCLTSLKLRALSLVHEIGFILTRPVQEPLSAECIERKQRLVNDYQRWHAAFEKLMKKRPQAAGILDPRAPLTLQIEYHVSYFWLSKCNAYRETEYDEHLTDFTRIVECAEQIITLTKSLESGRAVPRRFNMEAPITPSLYWTAYKCRYPLLRRRAIQAILNFPSCQGGWENVRHAATACRIMEIEEGPVCHLPVEERFVENEWRVIEPLQDSANVKIHEGVELLLLMKPYGPDGEIVERTEFVEWWKQLAMYRGNLDV